MKLLISFLFICLFFLPPFIQPTTFYVNPFHPAASDSSEGINPDFPFRTIQKGINSAYQGDSVLIYPGTYNLSSRLLMINSGSEGQEIVFKAIGEVFIIFPDSISKGLEWDNTYNNYLVLDGFDISGSKAPVFIQGSYNKIINCTIHDSYRELGKGGDLISIAGGSHNYLAFNKFYNSAWNGIHVESRLITDGENGRADYNLIEFNECFDNPAHFGINFFPNNDTTQHALIGNTIRFNKIYNCNGGIYLRYFQDGFIYGNLIYNNFNNGIFLHYRQLSDSPYPFPANLMIYNNTLVNNTPYSTIRNAAFTNIELKNNIYVQNRNSATFSTSHTGGIISDYNVYYNPATTISVFWGDTNLTLSGIQALGQEINSFDEDPYLDSVFFFTDSSIALNNGTELNQPFHLDMNGNLRGQGPGWEIGAFEKVTSFNSRLSVRLFLEGAYNNGTMRNNINTLSLIPNSQPFNIAPWNYSGTEYNSTIPSNVVDWILVELRSDSIKVVKREACFLLVDGTITSSDLISPIYFDDMESDSFYVVIYHRNHLPVMSAQKIYLDMPVEPYDFTDSILKAYGNSSLADLGNGVFGLFAGDTDKSGVINTIDKNLINQNNLTAGYDNADTNMSGIVTAADKKFVNINNNKREFVP